MIPIKFFTYDPSLCILCHRCVNTCKELVGRGAIDTMNRGFQSVIGAHYKHKWNEVSVNPAATVYRPVRQVH